MSRRCRPGLLPRGNEIAPVGTSVLPCDCITPGLMPTEAAPSDGDDFNEFQEAGDTQEQT